MEGNLFDIQRFSTHDGPGIRTTVFFKGCNLHCLWCHNPESISPKQEIQWLPYKCINCGACIRACTGSAFIEDVWKRDKCIACGACTKVCYAGARLLTLKRISADEVVKEVLLDKAFYKNNGGFTASGGEPLLQLEFLIEILQKIKREGVHTAVDTAGNLPWSSFERLLPYVDLFLFDIKHTDNVRHMKGTGAENVQILSNLKRLCDNKANIWVRIPCIPEFNTDETSINQITQMLLPYKAQLSRVDLLPFHKLGGGKYESLGQKYVYRDVLDTPEEVLKKWRRTLADNGFRVVRFREEEEYELSR